MSVTLNGKVANWGSASAPLDLTAAVDATSVNGLNLATTQTATAGNQKFSPALHFQGSGWKTNATAGPESADWRLDLQPEQGAADPVGILTLSYSVNGGAYATKTVFRGDGDIRHGGNLYMGLATNSTYLSANTVGTNSSGVVTWSSSTNAISADTGLSRISAGVVAVGTGSQGSFAGTFKATTLLQESANGAQWTHGQASELLTLSTGGTTTDTSANLLPAGAVIESVVARVTTTITTATSWQLGDPTTAGRFTAANATMTAGTTDIGILHWSGAVNTLAAGPSQAAAAKVRVTTVGTPGAGAIRITVFYRQFVAPTS